MGDRLFLQLIIASATTIPIILLLKLLSNKLSRRYSAKWKYYVWLVLAVRLLVPWSPSLPVQPVEIVIPETGIVREYEAVETGEWTVSQPVDIPILQTSVSYDSEKETVVLPQASKEMVLQTGYPEQAKISQNVMFPEINPLLVAELIWLLVAIGYLGYHMVVNVWNGRKLQRWSRPVDDTLSAQILEALGADCPSGHPEVWIHPQISGPMLAGLWKTKLYLPERCYKTEELGLILRHELTHYRRKDLWYKALMLFVNGVHWFNPFVYLMCREAEKDLECSCDSTVIADVERNVRCNYAHLILDTAAGQNMSGRLLTSNFYGGAKDMKRRLQNILDTKKKKHGIMIFFVLVIISVGAGSLVGFKLGQSTGECSVVQEGMEKKKELAEQILAEHEAAVKETAPEENPLPDNLAPDKELVGDKKFESPIEFLNEHMVQRVDKDAKSTYVSLGREDATVSAYIKEGAGMTFYKLEYGNNLYNDIHYEIKDSTLICEVGLYQGQSLYRGKAILPYIYENGEYVIDEERVDLELDWYSDITARNSLWMHSQIMEERDGLLLLENGGGEDRLTLHRAVYGKTAYNVLTVYLGNGLVADYNFPSNHPIVNDISHIYSLPMQSDYYQTLILTLSDPYLQSTDESTDFYIFHVEVNEEGTQAEIVLDAVILDNGTDSENYEAYQDKYLEMPFYHVISDMEAGPYYHEDLGVVTLKVVGMPLERGVEQACYVYWDGEAWKTYFE